MLQTSATSRLSTWHHKFLCLIENHWDGKDAKKNADLLLGASNLAALHSPATCGQTISKTAWALLFRELAIFLCVRRVQQLLARLINATSPFQQLPAPGWQMIFHFFRRHWTDVFFIRSWRIPKELETYVVWHFLQLPLLPGVVGATILIQPKRV